MSAARTVQAEWEHDYRQNRYMEALSTEDLDQRYLDVLNNYINLTPTGLVGVTGFDNPKRPDTYWLEALTHVGHEFQLRGSGLPERPDIEQVTMLAQSSGVYSQAAAAVAKVKCTPPYLVRYASRSRIGDMLTHGRICVTTASALNDSSLGVARCDNELETGIGIPGSSTDYFVFCTSAALRPRLFADFKADAALIIRDPGIFLDRLDAAVSKKIAFEWNGAMGPISYHDPLRSDRSTMRPGFWKHFRFAYQVEWRFAWLPMEPTSLSQFLVDLGSLADIAEPIYL